MEEKPLINLVFAGHLDGGKSTLVGRMLYELGRLPEQTISRLRRHAKAAGKETFFYAFNSDRSLEERERGISIEAHFDDFETEQRRFNIIDAPGHQDFVKNMIMGAAKADVGVLVLDAQETSHEELQPQTREHLILLHSLGVEKLIIVANKMDLVDYSREIYESLKIKIEDFLKQVLCKFQDELVYVPASAYCGENVVESSDRLLWYSGPTFLEALEGIEQPHRLVDAPLRMPIVRTFNVQFGAAATGKIETGRVRPGDTVVIVPYPGIGSITGRVSSIKCKDEDKKEATAGDDVGLLLEQLEQGFVIRKIKKGFMLAGSEHPPVEAERFKARIVVLDHPSEIRAGYTPYLHCHQASLPCRITEIEDVRDSKSNEPKESNSGSLVNGDTATVWIEPQKPLVIEKAQDFPRLGRFALRDGRTIGSGACLEIVPKENRQ